MLSGQEEVKADRRVEQWLFTRDRTKVLGRKMPIRSFSFSETADKLLNTRARATHLPDKDQGPGCTTDFS